jgi:hypothetical protein
MSKKLLKRLSSKDPDSALPGDTNHSGLASRLNLATSASSPGSRGVRWQNRIGAIRECGTDWICGRSQAVTRVRQMVAGVIGDAVGRHAHSTAIALLAWAP